MRWIAYDPDDAEKKDELSDEDLDNVAGGKTEPPPPGYP
jgi:hypothetical protein